MNFSQVFIQNEYDSLYVFEITGGKAFLVNQTRIDPQQILFISVLLPCSSHLADSKDEIICFNHGYYMRSNWKVFFSAVSVSENSVEGCAIKVKNVQAPGIGPESPPWGFLDTGYFSLFWQLNYSTCAEFSEVTTSLRVIRSRNYS